MCNSAKHHFIFHLMLFHKIQFGVFDVIGYFAATLISLQPGFSSIISPIKHIGRVHHLGAAETTIITCFNIYQMLHVMHLVFRFKISMSA